MAGKAAKTSPIKAFLRAPGAERGGPQAGGGAGRGAGLERVSAGRSVTMGTAQLPRERRSESLGQQDRKAGSTGSGAARLEAAADRQSMSRLEKSAAQKRLRMGDADQAGKNGSRAASGAGGRAGLTRGLQVRPLQAHLLQTGPLPAGTRRHHEIGDRKLQIKTGGLMNIFIIIDASKSVGKKNFNTAKEIAQTFIEKVSSYVFTPRYSVLTYASNPKTIVTLSDDDSTDAEKVIESIAKFDYKEHDDKQGTNTRAALVKVLEQLSLDHDRNKDEFYKASNIILLMTDGKHNMGGDPRVEVNRIRYALNITNNPDREKYLDIYVFGVGSDNSEEELNDIASKKGGNERHVFLMKGIEDLKKSFDDLIDESEAFEMCGLSKDHSDNLKEKYPWMAKIKITRTTGEESCKGSVVSKNFILTAAHCFHLDDELHFVDVFLGDGIQRKIQNIHRHPGYKPSGKQDKNIQRSFDFDFALLELETRVEFSSLIRPICLPCTSGASWALKRRGNKETKCEDHHDLLLTGDLVKAMFVTEENEKDNFAQMDVTIKQGNKREGCLDDAKKVPQFQHLDDIRDVVTDNFLCTGGTEPTIDPQTCKGDSGGPLIIQYKKRFFQTGVISWGTVNSCQGLQRGRVPNDSRDFHANVFKANDWIKEVVKEDLIYLN